MIARTDTPPTWTLDEADWQPRRNRVWESLCTVGNGYLGVRGFPEEPFDAGPSDGAIYVAGLFDESGADGIPSLVPAVNFLSVEILLDGAALRMTPGGVREYRRVLDMKRGLLRRSFVHVAERRSTRLDFERFASLAEPHLAGQSVAVTPLDWSGPVEVRLWVGGPPPAGPLGERLRPVHGRHMGRQRILLVAETAGSRIRLAHACRAGAWVRQAAPPRPGHLTDGARLGLAYRAVLECCQRAVFERLVTTYTSRDPETTSVERCCLGDLTGPDGSAYGAQRRRHVRRWAERWRRADVAIDGPADDQRAIRFAVFQLVAACPQRDPSVSIAAKGLTGPGYRGHVFWDTEIFMLPHFLWTHPGSANRLLTYRWLLLDGARRKARQAGYAGAMFPWESAESGEETCPSHVPDPKTGRPVRVLTGRLQHHVSADVVYAAWQYVRVTGDDHFRERQFLALAVETARFWASRARFNPRRRRYDIRDVIGPDEYHEHVDNNAYTNHLAAWNLRLAADEAERMRAVHARGRLLGQLAVGDEEIARWRALAGAMFLPAPGDDGLIEQHEGFFRLEQADPRELSSVTSPNPESVRMRKVRRCQVLKQADVLMLLALMGERFGPPVKRRNWDYYEPRTTHDSSLSPAVHSLVASDLGLTRKAYEYFRRSALLDLDDTMGNTAAGLHLAAMGGTWQAVVAGFAGLRVGDDGRPRVRCALPGAWRRLRTCVQCRKRWYVIEADATSATVRPEADRALPAAVTR